MCDCLVALAPATAQRCTLFAKNSDRPPDEVQRLQWSPPRRDRDPVRATHISVHPHPDDTLGCLLSIPTWCWGAEHGVNTAGVAIGNVAIYTRLDPRSAPPALIGMDLVRLALERAATALAAVDVVLALLEQYGQGGTGHDPLGASGPKAYWSSFLVADPQQAFVVETSGRQTAVDEIQEVAAISNRTTIADFDREHRHPRQPVADLVDPRLAASRAVLHERPVTIDALTAHLRSHDSCAKPGWSVCMHARDDAGNLVEVTTASMIAELHSDGSPHRARVLDGTPCERAYREVSIG